MVLWWPYDPFHFIQLGHSDPCQLLDSVKVPHPVLASGDVGIDSPPTCSQFQSCSTWSEIQQYWGFSRLVEKFGRRRACNAKRKQGKSTFRSPWVESFPPSPSPCDLYIGNCGPAMNCFEFKVLPYLSPPTKPRHRTCLSPQEEIEIGPYTF